MTDPTAVLQDAFRECMARVPAPVTVITTMLDGAPYGVTVSAFASLSVNPPMVFFALDNRGSMIEHLRQAGRAGVNLLSGGQAEAAVTFARKDLADRFAIVDWTDDHGLPRLSGVAAWLRCDLLEFRPGGDHTIVLAQVAAAEPLTDVSLSYHLRHFLEISTP
ncbi:flavin reductase family protein [Tessaracoccus caeni]|uniref:flavin reductase family protein n=1 Tax=Tessaracoccus caeni TaxID=3031239 RepID=UPI0023DAA02B|nr:flavin reductase family protein [Tessaracoccus caeni]MDF1489905.1 flavin reductase family protein [Tessaracoccus caeni]